VKTSKSVMVVNHPEVVEFDINPLIVHAESKGASMPDSRIMLRKPGAEAKCCGGH